MLLLPIMFLFTILFQAVDEHNISGMVQLVHINTRTTAVVQPAVKEAGWNGSSAGSSPFNLLALVGTICTSFTRAPE